MPSFEIIDRGKEVVVIAELPGYKEENIAVDCDGKTITIEGNVTEDAEQKQEGIFFKEQSSSSFKESATLPARVDPKKARVSYKNGVLEITIPKK